MDVGAAGTGRGDDFDSARELASLQGPATEGASRERRRTLSGTNGVVVRSSPFRAARPGGVSSAYVTATPGSAYLVRLEALAARLEAQADAFAEQRDSRCVFAHAYALMTRRIADELPGSTLSDPEWVVDLAEVFGGRYFFALDAYERGGDVPPAWQVVFDTLATRRTSVLEDLMFGVYAHIVRDLPHALVDCGLSDGEGHSRVRDHHEVTAIVGRAIDDIQQAVATRYGPYVHLVDRIGRRYDEILTDYGIRLSRGMAWYNALRLADPASAAAAAASLERSTSIFVAQVVDPPIFSLRATLRALRWIAAHVRRWR